MNIGQEIYHSARACEAVFSQITQDEDAPSFVVTETLRQRFDQWSSNMGVFALPQFSLDARLAHSDSLRSMVLELLAIMKTGLDRVVEVRVRDEVGETQESIIKNMGDKESPETLIKRMTADKTRDGAEKQMSANEMQEAIVKYMTRDSGKLASVLVESLQTLRSTVDSLERFGSAIRQSSSVERLTQRIENYKQKSNEGFLEDVIFLRLKHMLVDRPKYEQDGESADDTRGATLMLCKQLAASVAYRYFSVMYRRHHEQKRAIKREDKPAMPQKESRNDDGQQPPPVTQTKSLQGPKKLSAIPRHLRPPPSERTGSMPSLPNSTVALNTYASSQASFVGAKSVISIQPENVTLPKPPVIVAPSVDASCPYCLLRFRRDMFSSQRWWKQHIQSDLKLYTCISEDCCSPPLLFASYDEWKKHMEHEHTPQWTMNVHRPASWSCNLDHDEEWFYQEKDYEDHMTTVHADLFEDYTMDDMKDFANMQRPRARYTCPVCNCIPPMIYSMAATTPNILDEERPDLRKELMKHIGQHLKQIGFLSVGYLEDNDEGASEASRNASALSLQSRNFVPKAKIIDSEWTFDDDELRDYIDVDYISSYRNPELVRVHSDNHPDATLNIATWQAQWKEDLLDKEQTLRDNVDFTRKWRSHLQVSHCLKALANWLFIQKKNLYEAEEVFQERVRFCVENLNEEEQQDSRQDLLVFIDANANIDDGVVSAEKQDRIDTSPIGHFGVWNIPLDWDNNQVLSILSSDLPDAAVRFLAYDIDWKSKTAIVSTPRIPDKTMAIHHFSEENGLGLELDYFTRDTTATLFSPPAEDHKIDIVVVTVAKTPFEELEERSDGGIWLANYLPYDLPEFEVGKPSARIILCFSSTEPTDPNQDIVIKTANTVQNTLLRLWNDQNTFRPIILLAKGLAAYAVKEVICGLVKSNESEDTELLKALSACFFLPRLSDDNNYFNSLRDKEFESLKDVDIVYLYATQDSEDNEMSEKISPVPVERMRLRGIDITDDRLMKFGPHEEAYTQVTREIQALVHRALPPPERDLEPSSESEITREVLQWLAFPKMNDRFESIEPAYPGTCKWIYNHDMYAAWHSGAQKLLWLKGIPGSGKSVLIKHLLTQDKESNGRLLLSFFFIRSGSHLQKSAKGCLRSLLWQIIFKDPVALSDVVASIQERRQDPMELDADQLWMFFEIALSRIIKTRPVWLFIDALDESSHDDAHFLSEKVRAFTRAEPPVSFYAICSSRYWPSLSHAEESCIYLEEENQADIRKCTANELAGINGVGSIPSYTRMAIVQASSGMFLRARLVLRSVGRLVAAGVSNQEIENAVRSTPHEIYNIYRDVLHSMGESSLTLVQWMCCMYDDDPLHRSLHTVVSMQTQWSLNDMITFDKQYSDSSKQERLQEISCGFVVDGVRFFGQSVRDFFLEQGLLLLDPDSGSSINAVKRANLEICKTCLRVLNMEGIQQLVDEPDICKHPELVQYASKWWIYHLRESNADHAPHCELLELLGWPSVEHGFLDSWAKMQRRLMSYYGTKSKFQIPPGASAIHILARCGARHLLEAALKKATEDEKTGKKLVDAKDKAGRTALTYAAEEGHTKCAELLIQSGLVDIHYVDYSGSAPLSYAAKSSTVSSVSLLLSLNAEPDINDGAARTPLSYAAEAGAADCVRVLLDTGKVNPDSKDTDERTPLSYAAEAGAADCVQVLLKTKGVDVNSKSKDGMTPLSYACMGGHVEVVQTLLDTGVTLAMNFDEGKSPFDIAKKARKNASEVKEILDAALEHAQSGNSPGGAR